MDTGTMINQLMRVAAIVVFLSLVSLSSVHGQSMQQGSEQRNFDARVDYNHGFKAAQSAEQLQSKKDFQKRWTDANVDYSPELGTARNIKSHTKFLSSMHHGYNPRDLAIELVSNQRKLLGLSQADIANLEITNDISMSGSTAHHVFMRQRFKDIPVFGGGVQVHIDNEGRLQNINSDSVRQLASSVARTTPSLSAAEAVIAAAQHLGITVQQPPSVFEEKTDPQQTTRLSSPGVSSEEIVAQLLWMPVRDKDTRLVWNLQIHTLDDLHVYDITIDTASGQVWTRFDLIASASYQVYQQPSKSPDHSLPLPPLDGRQTVYDPADPIVSPLGWHNSGSASYTTMHGNNVYAYEDSRRLNRPVTLSDCTSSLTCAFALDLTQYPSSYRPAAVTNLFYWTNLAHDIFYNYGFDEASGNFQVNNFNKGGAGNDLVIAEAQDGSGQCNANFYTPRDGGSGRMQMFSCNKSTPPHDGDFDNGVIIHEYGHGVTNRLVGGPANVSCLGNNQQPGEGWSDFFALVFTANLGDAGTDARGIANYLFGLPLNSNGIRPQPYSTDPAKNNYTYASINADTEIHSLGSVWAEVIWKMYWHLVDQHGFNANLSNPPALSALADPKTWADWKGNQRALFYVVDGLKYTACSPTFVDARDGIIASATANFGGEDLCPIWKAFADFGLGTDAVSGGSNNTSLAINGFSLPPGVCPVIPPSRTLTVTSVSPSSGLTIGGTVVTIT
ncbi:MAG: extracellular metalloproteinase, partial [Methylococcaceae bacterium]